MEFGKRIATILMVDDSVTDVMLVREALEDSTIEHRLFVMEDGELAMAFLNRQGEHHNAPRPDFILLDLNMPTKNGLEVLAEMKTNERLKDIPIVVFTTSEAKSDVMKCYGNFANCYVKKPMDFEAFAEAVRAIAHFWLTIATLPPNSPEYGN